MPTDAEKAAVRKAWDACADHGAVGAKAFVVFLNKHPEHAGVFSFAGAGKTGDDIAGSDGVNAHGKKVMEVFDRALKDLEAGNKDKVAAENDALGKDHIKFKLQDDWFKQFREVFQEVATAEMHLEGDAVSGLMALYDAISGHITSNMH